MEKLTLPDSMDLPGYGIHLRGGNGGIRLHIYWNPRMRQRKHGHMSFSCILHIRWEGRDLTVASKVVNKDQEIMYFTVGAHPAFNVPILPDTKREDYHLTFSGQKELTYHLLDTRYGTAIPEKSPYTCLKMEAVRSQKECLIKMR